MKPSKTISDRGENPTVDSRNLRRDIIVGMVPLIEDFVNRAFDSSPTDAIAALTITILIIAKKCGASRSDLDKMFSHYMSEIMGDA